MSALGQKQTFGNAAHSPLEDQAKALDGICGNVAARIFLGRMIERFLCRKFLVNMQMNRYRRLTRAHSAGDRRHKFRPAGR
jgi:hypothetical protein